MLKIYLALQDTIIMGQFYVTFYAEWASDLKLAHGIALFVMGRELSEVAPTLRINYQVT